MRIRIKIRTKMMMVKIMIVITTITKKITMNKNKSKIKISLSLASMLFFPNPLFRPFGLSSKSAAMPDPCFLIAYKKVIKKS